MIDYDNNAKTIVQSELAALFQKMRAERHKIKSPISEPVYDIVLMRIDKLQTLNDNDFKPEKQQ